MVDLAADRILDPGRERPSAARIAGCEQLPRVQRAKDALGGNAQRPGEIVQDALDARLAVLGNGSKDQIHRRAQHRVDATERGGVTD
jgi:hypothetical protein